ncbi:hypothetical protein [Pendulispora brunnea]
MMVLFTLPAVVSAIVAIIVRRSMVTYVALAGGALGIVGFFLGA